MPLCFIDFILFTIYLSHVESILPEKQNSCNFRASGGQLLLSQSTDETKDLRRFLKIIIKKNGPFLRLGNVFNILHFPVLQTFGPFVTFRVRAGSVRNQHSRHSCVTNLSLLHVSGFRYPSFIHYTGSGRGFA